MYMKMEETFDKIYLKYLMIWDWFKIDHQLYQIRKVQDFLEYEELENEYGGLDPIPLTPKILTDNGFTKGSNWNYKNVNIMKYLDNKIEYNVEVIGFPPCEIDANIKYVHELQHILNICHINKMLDLW